MRSWFLMRGRRDIDKFSQRLCFPAITAGLEGRFASNPALPVSSCISSWRKYSFVLTILRGWGHTCSTAECRCIPAQHVPREQAFTGSLPWMMAIFQGCGVQKCSSGTCLFMGWPCWWFTVTAVPSQGSEQWRIRSKDSVMICDGSGMLWRNCVSNCFVCSVA